MTNHNDTKDQDPGGEMAPAAAANQLVDVLKRLTLIQERQPIPQETVAQATFVTPWNPTGKKTRPRLRRRVFLNGHPLSDTRLTEDEVTLLNSLKHGRYHNRQWLVLERDEEGTSSLHVFFPNKTESQRIEHARLAPNGLVDLLRMMHDEMQTVKLAG